MSANNDNAMARFLFAILRQKNLKDIDWNQVANDPVLTQPISNGHAARMRYSRFRTAMLGLEPQRRNRTSVAKSRPSSKSKKGSTELKSKKEETANQEDQEIVEQEAAKAAPVPNRNASPSRIKQEMFQPAATRKSTTGSAATMTTTSAIAVATAAMFSDGHAHYQGRLLTPCSDTDMIMAPQGYAGSPASDMMPPETPFDFVNPAHCSDEHGSWHHHSPTYPAFGSMACELDFSAGLCEPDPHQPEELCIPAAAMEPNVGHAGVKHEGWDSPHYSI